MARFSNTKSFDHIKCFCYLAQLNDARTQRQQFTTPATGHFPAQGHRAVTPNYRWINR